MVCLFFDIYIYIYSCCSVTGSLVVKVCGLLFSGNPMNGLPFILCDLPRRVNRSCFIHQASIDH